MYQRLILNDLKNNKFTAIATWIFMSVNAALLGLSVLLFVSLSGSIDKLMNVAETPDFLQMHTGVIDENALLDFANQRSEIDKMQICRFLNISNSQIRIGGKSLDGNMQDNGLCYQSESFDYLVDMDNQVIIPHDGEIYVPICYKNEYDINLGDLVSFGTETLTIAGFLRDSQMNSMMASSKRFLVSEEDYRRLSQLGSEEYLIEFKLQDGSDLGAFTTAYEDAGLPGNGPTITYPLIRMMNALSDGMMIMVILLISIGVLFISILCIRCLILTGLEKDKYEIGMMKAVGVSRKDIKGIYLSKYLLLSVVGTLVGFLIALTASVPLSSQMKALYGDSGKNILIYILMIMGEILVEAVILLSINRTLKGIEKAPAVSILNGLGSFGKKKNLWIPATIITIVAVFIILVPLNLSTTLRAPEFVTYMGIGSSQIRIDVRQMDDIGEISESISEELARDDRVDDFVLMRTGSYKTEMPDGENYNLLIENGNHSKFPVRYSKGTYPKSDDEIALSILNAQELGLDIGDRVDVYLKPVGVETSIQKPCTVCGIYSDVTNGGKTAKACFDSSVDDTPVMWSVFYVSLEVESYINKWMEDFKTHHQSINGEIKVTSIKDYLNGVYGQTIRNIGRAAIVTTILAIVVLFVVILLLLRLLIWKQRRDNSLKKAFGFTSRDIQKDYFKKIAIVACVGIVCGTFAGVFLGQILAGAFLSSLGAQGLRFIINPAYVFALTPVLVIITVFTAAYIGLIEIKSIGASECLQAGTGR